jgi:hypothetical protein
MKNGPDPDLTSENRLDPDPAHISQQCCGSEMFSRIQDTIFSIPDPGYRVDKIPDPRSESASKNLSILSQKLILSCQK